MAGEHVCISNSGGACLTGGHVWQGACMAGGVNTRGLCMAGGMHGRGCMAGQHAWHTSPPVDRITDVCKNITLPQTLFAGGKYTNSLIVSPIDQIFQKNQGNA